jgi:hypothetical protein
VEGFILQIDFDEALEAPGAPVVVARRRDCFGEAEFGVASYAIHSELKSISVRKGRWR